MPLNSKVLAQVLVFVIFAALAVFALKRITQNHDNQALSELSSGSSAPTAFLPPSHYTDPSPSPQSSEPKTWHKVTEFKGSAIKNTPSFHISGNEWRLQWETRPGKYGAMNFQIYVYNADGTMKDVAANVIGEGKDETTLRGSGDYYLAVNTAQSYKIGVEELR